MSKAKKISPPHRGLWVYKPTWIGADTSVTALEAYLDANDINEVYLSCNLATLASDHLAGFIRRMSAKCVTVEALIGKPEWGTAIGRPDMLSQLDKILAYNTAHDEESRFTAVHLDVEPWINTGQSLAWLNPLIGTYLAAAKHIKGLTLNVDMSGSKIQNASLSQRQALVDMCASVVLMQYEASADDAVRRTRKFADSLEFQDNVFMFALRKDDFAKVREIMTDATVNLSAIKGFGGWAIYQGQHDF